MSKPKSEKDIILSRSSDIDENHMQTASMTDFTGLIPNGITDDDEAEFYEELCPYLPPKVYGDLEK